MVISREPVSCQEIMSRFPQFFVDSVGDLDCEIKAVAAPETAKSGEMVFLSTAKAFTSGLQSSASVLVISAKNRPEAEAKRGDKTILIASNVEIAMSQVISEFFLKTPYTNRSIQNIHPSAYVSPDAELGTGVRIGPHAFIGSKVKLGPNVYVGASAVVEDYVEVGDNTVIHPQVFIGHSCLIGKRCEVHPNSVIGKEGFGYAHDEKWNHFRIPHQGRVTLEDDVHIGACCTIDRATLGETRIERGAKFDNHVHIAHNCKVGTNALLTAGFTMAGSSKIGANFVTGGKTVVTGHIEICDNVQLAALSAVSKSITTPGQYGGNPLQPLQKFIKTKVAMTHLPLMRRQIKRILEKLGMESDAASD